MKTALETILIVIIVLGLVIGIGWFGVFLTKTVGKAQQDANREVWENTTGYVKGMVDDLAKYKYEFETTKDITNKQAIIDLIISKYADFPSNKIDNSKLRYFLEDVRNGTFNNLEGDK